MSVSTLPADGVPSARAPAGIAHPGRCCLFSRWVDFLAQGWAHRCAEDGRGDHGSTG